MAVSSEVRTRENGASGGNVNSINAGTTGQFEDTTGSDTLTATDDINYQFLTNGTSGAITWSHVGCMIENIDPDSAIKTFNGLARASAATVKGLSLASVKTWNGLA